MLLFIITTTTATFIHTIQVEEEEKKKKKENKYIENKIIGDIQLYIYTIFKLVCISQSSKAFELAAAYLQVKKGTKQ